MLIDCLLVLCAESKRSHSSTRKRTSQKEKQLHSSCKRNRFKPDRMPTVAMVDTPVIARKSPLKTALSTCSFHLQSAHDLQFQGLQIEVATKAPWSVVKEAIWLAQTNQQQKSRPVRQQSRCASPNPQRTRPTGLATLQVFQPSAGVPSAPSESAGGAMVLSTWMDQVDMQYFAAIVIFFLCDSPSTMERATNLVNFGSFLLHSSSAAPALFRSAKKLLRRFCSK